ncbi:5-formyltetrahydrofolate cyclo-ligase [Parvularcula bermudensis HTCC2503]|uniref:5-formyltetrahydrofolate cyclo-ligase n=2 Tax=Parvularcula TaxID=208215 RepID=E0TCP0_PARBH|nr:5-formyltetrahydrofolate cyclo-ligase [Parvularcula bermudensis HTCC2503]
MKDFAPDQPSAIALYAPKGQELDTAPLAKRLSERGHAILLPVVTAQDAPLEFRLWEIDRPLVEGRFGIPVPPADSPKRLPQIIVTPLLAVRPDGARLGHGGGYYDRTLSALRTEGPGALAIGYGYEGQVMDRFPVETHDQFLDGFASEVQSRIFPQRPA